MENLKVTIKRANAKFENVIATGAAANEVRITFKSESDKSLATFVVKKDEATNLWTLSDAKTFHQTPKRFIRKYMSEQMTTSYISEKFITLQGYIKSALKDVEKGSQKAQSIPTQKAEPKAEATEVKREQAYRPAATPKVGLEAQIFNMVAEGINDKSTTEIIHKATKKFLDDHGIVPTKLELSVKRIDGSIHKVGRAHKKFKTILQTISARVPVALVGPAGSGKTTTVEKVAEALNLKFYAKSVSAQTGSHEFFGYQDANGNYVKTLFREAYENGGVFLLDEFDAGNPNVLAALNQATANEKTAFADGMISKHEDFVIVMAGNTYGHGATTDYVGRNKIDAATLDRFAFIHFDYDEDLEMAVASNKEWTKKVQRIRKEVAAKKIKAIVSPRASINGSKLLATGMEEKEVMELVILKELNQDERNLLKSVL